MGRSAGRMQEILEGTDDALSFPFKVDGVPQLATAATVEIRSRGDAVLQVATATGVTFPSAGLVKYTRTWDTATFPYGDGYRAEWLITYGGDTYTHRQYFDVVRRRFESGLVDSDLTDQIPNLSAQSSDGFAAWRKRAWDRIYSKVRAHTKKHPGDFTRPELLFEAHRSLSLAMFCRSNSRHPTDEWWALYEEYKDEWEDEFKDAMGFAIVDDNRDLTEGDDEKRRQLFANWGR